MEKNYFNYNGRPHYIGTLVKINDNHKQHCGFYTTLKFTGYDINDNSYCFSSLYDMWKIYKFSNEEISMYIETILEEGNCITEKKKMNPQYIEGIVSAWIWYILIMLFALFFKGTANILITWIAATFIFFRWRYNKINGG